MPARVGVLRGEHGARETGELAGRGKVRHSGDIARAREETRGLSGGAVRERTSPGSRTLTQQLRWKLDRSLDFALTWLRPTVVLRTSQSWCSFIFKPTKSVDEGLKGRSWTGAEAVGEHVRDETVRR